MSSIPGDQSSTLLEQHQVINPMCQATVIQNAAIKQTQREKVQLVVIAVLIARLTKRLGLLYLEDTKRLRLKADGQRVVNSNAPLERQRVTSKLRQVSCSKAQSRFCSD